MKTYFICLFVVTLHLIGFCQQTNPRWIVYNTANSNLPYNTVTDVSIDLNGNIWLGTYGGGIARYDGLAWGSYTTSNSGLSSNNITSIKFDNEGQLWIGLAPEYSLSGYIIGAGGIVHFDGNVWTSYNASNSGLSNDLVTSLAIETNNSKWICTEGGGLNKFEGGIWTLYTTANSGLPYNKVSHIGIESSGIKWIGTYGNGLAKFDGINWTIFNPSNSGLQNGDIYAIAIDKNNVKWFGTWGGGLARFEDSEWTIYNTINSQLPSNNINAICIDKNNNKWIGTKGGGLATFDGTDWQIYDTLNSELPSNNISSITIDAYGNKWVGTDAGLAVFNPNGISYSSNKDNLSMGSVSLITNTAIDKLTVTISHNNISEQVAKISIFNCAGNLCLQQQFNLPMCELNISSLKFGLYIAKIEIESKEIIRKFIILL